MNKKEIPGMTQKERLQAKAKNKLHIFILEEGNIRGAILHGTYMINEMRASHDLGILETLILGHSYIGASLMTSGLKGRDNISMKIDCSGPVKGLAVDANANGEVRGYLKNKYIPIDKPLESFDLSPFIGEGFLEVTRFPEYAKQPYTGKVQLIPGGIASNLANYFLVSEQTSTAFNLSIKFDSQGNVIGAGGLFLQALPESDKNRINVLELYTQTLPSIGEAFASGQLPEEFLEHHFHSFSPKILDHRRTEFFCSCAKENIKQILQNLEIESLTDIAKHGPFPLETHCQYCNTTYTFEKNEIDDLLKNRIEKITQQES